MKRWEWVRGKVFPRTEQQRRKGIIRERLYKRNSSRTAFLLEMIFSAFQIPTITQVALQSRYYYQKNTVEFMVYSKCPWNHVESFSYTNRLLVRALQSFFILWNRWHIEQFWKDEAWHSPPANHLYLIITTLIRIIMERLKQQNLTLAVHFALLEMGRQASYNAV